VFHKYGDSRKSGVQKNPRILQGFQLIVRCKENSGIERPGNSKKSGDSRKFVDSKGFKRFF
jgi:hypothetical protein